MTCSYMKANIIQVKLIPKILLFNYNSSELISQTNFYITSVLVSYFIHFQHLFMKKNICGGLHYRLNIQNDQIFNNKFHITKRTIQITVELIAATKKFFAIFFFTLGLELIQLIQTVIINNLICLRLCNFIDSCYELVY